MVLREVALYVLGDVINSPWHAPGPEYSVVPMLQ